MIQIKIKLFGAFRNFGNGEFLDLQAPKDSNIDQIKNILTELLNTLNPAKNNADLVTDSVLATEESILDSHCTLSSSCTLAILPPVCGG